MRSVFACLVSFGAAAITLGSLVTAPMAAQQHDAATRTKVVVISLDAFGAESLHDPYLPAPTLHWLMKNGSYAVSMQPINPTVTWPNHTAMVTGVDASLHHVLANGLIVDQRTDAQPHIDADAPKSQLVAVPTVYDLAHKAGMTTAEVDWVAITKADTIDWRFAERPDPDGAIERDLIADGVVTRDDLQHFGHPSQAWRDRIYTRAAVDIIAKHHPDLLLVHLLALDGIEHKTGFGNDSGRNTIAFLDDRVQEIMNAVRSAGDFDRTAFIVVSDHGQQSVFKHLHGNVLLQQAGLQKPGTDLEHETFCLSEGGLAYIYQKNATDASRAALKQIFAGKPGVVDVLLPGDAAKAGFPTPQQSDQGPDLVLFAANGYQFNPEPSDEFVTAAKESGAHGYSNTEPKMQAIFIAFGAGFKSSGQIPAFINRDVAPTIAHLLGVGLPHVQGVPLTQILK